MGRATPVGVPRAKRAMFQSTPGPDGPGDGAPLESSSLRSVSIHARSGWAGRQVQPCDGRHPIEFQSTPGPDGPGDLDGTSDSGLSSSFNPRPVRMGRATPSPSCARRWYPLFQSTPGPDGPGDRTWRHAGYPAQVSIHARSGWAGRPSHLLSGCTSQRFNPRPVRMGRATVKARLAQQAVDVSIHARSGWAGRPRAATSLSSSDKFQSTPGPDGPGDPAESAEELTRREFQSTPGPDGPGDFLRVCRRPARRGFNPRPVRMGRATYYHFFHAEKSPVSIHARSGWAGRLGCHNAGGIHYGFNPRPVRMGRATRAVSLVSRRSVSSFNPRPVRMGRATRGR